MAWRAFIPLLRLTMAGYTDGVVNAVSAAWRLADSRGHPALAPEHLLAGMAGTRQGRATLDRLGLLPHGRAEEILALVPPASGVPSRCADLGREVRDLLASARDRARRAGCLYVGTEHVVLSLAAGNGNATVQEA